jgi:hypothetical protein
MIAGAHIKPADHRGELIVEATRLPMKEGNI